MYGTAFFPPPGPSLISFCTPVRLLALWFTLYGGCRHYLHTQSRCAGATSIESITIAFFFYDTVCAQDEFHCACCLSSNLPYHHDSPVHRGQPTLIPCRDHQSLWTLTTNAEENAGRAYARVEEREAACPSAQAIPQWMSPRLPYSALGSVHTALDGRSRIVFLHRCLSMLHQRSRYQDLPTTLCCIEIEEVFESECQCCRFLENGTVLRRLLQAGTKEEDERGIEEED
ncbi:hypothetical protein ARMGADRAFT_691285 [Armillaria gallica]|uniref:Uncharacterized protein n=1 Tax=Armillaria gallica TaxID=47427 RepID=A0A2H3DM23_ARMGA|nr:hypothetical protein ARMGADRAFT_691285 [Armillaria gallica]